MRRSFPLGAYPPQFTVPLDRRVAAWLQSLGKRAPKCANAILRAAMKATCETRKCAVPRWLACPMTSAEWKKVAHVGVEDKKSVPYHPLLMAHLIEPEEAGGYLFEAVKDSRAALVAAVANITEAHHLSFLVPALPPKPVTVRQHQQGPASVSEAYSHRAVAGYPSHLSYCTRQPLNPEMWALEPSPVLPIKLDPEIAAWLQSLGKRAHKRVNSILRTAMREEMSAKNDPTTATQKLEGGKSRLSKEDILPFHELLGLPTAHGAMKAPTKHRKRT